MNKNIYLKMLKIKLQIKYNLCLINIINKFFS